jgi:hypothetical protein
MVGAGGNEAGRVWLRVGSWKGRLELVRWWERRGMESGGSWLRVESWKGKLELVRRVGAAG